MHTSYCNLNKNGVIELFIVTAHIPRRRLLTGAVTALCCCVVIAAALIFILGGRAVTTLAEVSNIHSNDDRIAYLTGLGWTVSEQPVLSEELLIPKTLDQSYSDYLALQSKQGFDLTRYCGKRIKRYTYEVTNYSDGTIGVQAALLIYKSRIVGGQLQATDGSFILPLSGTGG